MDPIHQYVLGLIVLGLPAVSGSIFLLTKAIGNIARIRQLKAERGLDAERLEAQDRRMAHLEGDLGTLREELERLNAVEGFYKELRDPGPGPGLVPPPARAPEL